MRFALHNSRSQRHARVAVLSVAAALSLLVLVLTAETQIFDSTFYAMTGAQSILSGEWPYRDFFEPGVPLAAFMAAAGQVVTGHRLIGEFVRQWAFIVVGVLIALHLGLRLSRLIMATLLTLPITLFMLADTPIYHYSKLFFVPLAIWMAWRYIEQPVWQRGATLGLVSAAGFLERHDYGIYLGCASVLAWLLARCAVPSSRTVRSILGDAAAHAAAVLLVTAPWLIAVQRYEGLVAYTRARAALYQGAPAAYRSLFSVRAVTDLFSEPMPPPITPGVVGFIWQPYVTVGERQRLEREHQLSPLPDRDSRGRSRYRVANIYNTELLKLDPYVTDGAGFDWDRLNNGHWFPPSRERAALWLERMAMLVPLALGVSAAMALLRAWRWSEPVAPHVWERTFAAVFLAAVDAALFREPTYFVVAAPVAAALTAALLASRSVAVRALTGLLLAVSTVVAAVSIRNSPVSDASRYPQVAAEAFKLLTASPPAYDSIEFTYLRECTRPTDHVLVTGDNPLHVSYFSQRPIAGGHINWHRRWLADPVHEQRSLQWLQRQNVPVVVSLGAPVMSDFAPYPTIAAYLREWYREVQDTEGRVLVDTRRPVTGRFPLTGYPCFS